MIIHHRCSKVLFKMKYCNPLCTLHPWRVCTFLHLKLTHSITVWLIHNIYCIHFYFIVVGSSVSLYFSSTSLVKLAVLLPCCKYSSSQKRVRLKYYHCLHQIVHCRWNQFHNTLNCQETSLVFLIFIPEKREQTVALLQYVRLEGCDEDPNTSWAIMAHCSISATVTLGKIDYVDIMVILIAARFGLEL